MPTALRVVVLSLSLAAGAAAQTVADNFSHQTALTHYKAGEALFRDEMFERAADEFRIAIRYDPLLMMAHYQLGQSYMALHRYQEAILAYLAGRDAFNTIAVMIAKNDVYWYQ